MTSHYTLDAKNPAARREINQLGELIAAVRLPSGAHRRTAGTEAITDLIVLRRRLDDTAPTPASWEAVTPVTVDGGTLAINQYFVEHPDHVLGTLTVGRGMYRDDALIINGDLDTLPTQFADTLKQVAVSARSRDLVITDRLPNDEAVPQRPVEGLWEGSILRSADGSSFSVVTGGGLEPLKVPRSATRELTALVGLRDGATQLLDLEVASPDDSTELETQRRALLHRYETYVQRYGPLGRYTLRRTGRHNDAGDEIYARIVPTPIRLLRADPFGPVVLALEEFNDLDHTATPAAILTRRVVAPHRDTRAVETPADAVAVSLDRTGRIDLDMIADLLHTVPNQAETALAGLVFTDPETDQLVHAPAYLSGDVRAKLDTARARAHTDERFTANVEALQAVLPEDLGIEEITAQLGAVWISADVHQEFLADLLRTPDVRVENPLPGMWEVRGGRYGVMSTSEWGTQRRPAPAIAQAVMEQKSLVVYDEYEDDQGRTRRVLNPVETAAAQEKAEALQERFAEWVWEDPARAGDLVAEYNRRFNAIVLRDYTDAGDYLTFPTMAATFTPRPHQRAAVARMIAEPAAGLFHEVGAGKTAEMILGATEMKRIGLITKPVVVVPNHMLDQFTRDWLHIAPTARILAASSRDLTAERRRMFVAKAATNDWDGILMTQGAFAKIPVSPATEAAYLQRQVDRLRSALSNADGQQPMSVKRIQRKLLQLENRLRARLVTDHDDGITFEATGIDYAIVDEIHMYKNLSTESNIQDAAIAGSQRATDLHLKLEYLRSNGQDRIVTGATATPIANSITEAYVMQRYLRPDLLDAVGLGSFDAWAATFGTTVTQMEMAPTGNTFRLKTRFAQFRNVPEMLRMWSVFADVKTGADLQLPTPDIAARHSDGQRIPETIAVAPTTELEDFIVQLGERAETVARGTVTPDEDNMLTISTDGRKAALDIRMVTDEDPTGPTKVDIAADTIHRIWQATADNHYLDTATGEPSLIPGSLQLVFADIGTPHPDRWNAYDELHRQLVDRGIPDDMIRYIHQAATDTDKARLFAAARGGQIAVLIGSTAKMGVGTNVQARAVALHHLDCPWRPSDIAQREGRVLRQGNQNEEVAIIRYVTEGSFDAYMWQGVERKARFITQVMRGRLDTREIDEIDTATLTAAEAKAISSGNPLLLEHSQAQAEVARLERLHRAHTRNQAMLIATHQRAEQQAIQARRDIAALQRALARVTDTTDATSAIRINGTTYSRRADTARALAHLATQPTTPRFETRDLGVIGHIAGFDIQATSHQTPVSYQITVQLADVPGSEFTITPTDLIARGVGVVQRIENRVANIPTYLATATDRRDDAEQTIIDTQERIGAPFRHGEALMEAQQRLDAVGQRLRQADGSPELPMVASISTPAPATDVVDTPDLPRRRRTPSLER